MAVCQFISGIYKDVPTNAGKTSLLTQHHVRDDINKCLASYLGTEQQQQVSAFIWKKFWEMDMHIQHQTCKSVSKLLSCHRNL